MTATINASERPLSKIFSNDFIFNIPPYQRPYSWTTEQAGELLSDVLAFVQSEFRPVKELNPYFLGSIVLIKEISTPEADVVDGQQRLTTLTILLSVLRDFEDAEASRKLSKFMYQEEDEFREQAECYRLKVRVRDENFFVKYIQKSDGLEPLLALDCSQLTSSQQYIQANARYFKEKLEQLSDEERKRFATYLLTKCVLVVVSTPDLDSAYRIFSTLNARGLNLSLTDLLKSEIIGAIPGEEQEKYTRVWETEEEDLGREEFQELFSHVRMIYMKAKSKESTLNEFRKSILPKHDPKAFIDDVLKPYSDALEIIKKSNYQSDKDSEKTDAINACLGWLNQIDNVDWIPAGILYLSLYSQSSDKLEKFFTDLERLAAGLMIIRANRSTRISRYAKLLAYIEADDKLYIEDSPLQLTAEETQQVRNTLDGDLYRMTRIRQYVLLRLDSVLSEGAATYKYPVITLEHVLPQNPKQDSHWMTWFADKNREQYVHKIGNLTLLSRRKNAQAQNYDFDEKKKRYFEARRGVSPFALTTQVLKEDEWTPEVIERRQLELIETLENLWRL